VHSEPRTPRYTRPVAEPPYRTPAKRPHRMSLVEVWVAMALLAATLVLMAVGGCKSESSAPAAADAPSNADAAVVDGPCTVVTPAEAAVVLGVPTFRAPRVSVRPGITDCGFPDGERDPGLGDFPLPTADLFLRFETGQTLHDFANLRGAIDSSMLRDGSGQKTVDYPGLGDVAATFTLGPVATFGPVVVIIFLHKGTIIRLQGPFPPDRLATLARTIGSRR
jgi:hypothetical protein